jgi:hypothetical protein
VRPTDDEVFSGPMNEQVQRTRAEPRWPPALAILGVICLLQSLHPRLRLLPAWFPYVLAIAMLVPMAGVVLTSARAPWLRFERAMTFLFFVVIQAGTLLTLTRLIEEMLFDSKELSGLELLASSVWVWVLNVLAFSLLYWQLDRGGPHARANSSNPRPDWLFPQAGVPEAVGPDWHPTYVDYLFLGYSTATAFSATDASPLTSRAKILMMLQSLISLVTILIVASRAINILQ